jgi:hypothetical protein
MTKQERELVKEIRMLIKPKRFSIRIYDHNGIEVLTAWVGDTRYTVEEVYLINVTPRDKCISLDEFQKIMKEENEHIMAVCEESDRLAKENGEGRGSYFEKLLLEAKKL